MEITVKQLEELFFEKYNIPQQELTLEHREMLELTLIQMPFLDRIVEQDGEKFPIYKNYCIQYNVDQWWGAYAMELIKVDNNYYYDIAFKGEGDSQTLALLALLVEMHEILDEEQKQEIRNVFNTEESSNE